MYEEKRVGEKNLNRSVKFSPCAQKRRETERVPG